MSVAAFELRLGYAHGWDFETAMTSLAKLEAYTSELAAAVKSLTKYCQNVEAPFDFRVEKVPQSLIGPEASTEAYQARRSIIANVAKLQALFIEPADFLQQLAVQVRLSFDGVLLDTNAELKSIIAESAPRLFAVARRVSGPGLYTSQ